MKWRNEAKEFASYGEMLTNHKYHSQRKQIYIYIYNQYVAKLWKKLKNEAKYFGYLLEFRVLYVNN